MTERQLTSWFDPFLYQIVEKEQRPDAMAWGTPIEVYDLVKVFTTRDGLFDPSSLEGAIPPWAREWFMPWWAMQGVHYYSPVGGATHLFMLVLNADGSPKAGKQHWYWNTGVGALDGAYNNMGPYWSRLNGSQEGMTNDDIGSHDSGYTPPNRGAWSMCPYGLSDVLTGVGRFKGYHVSTFAIWQARIFTTPPPPPADSQLDRIEDKVDALTGSVASLDTDIYAMRQWLHMNMPA